MLDTEILDLYWQRDESAILETDRKYGPYCRAIALGILHAPEDAEECLNDTWLRAWNAIPPQRPRRLRPFLAKITRNLSFDRYKARHAQKRGQGELPLILEELESCIPPGPSPEDRVLEKELESAIDRFVRSLPVKACNVFVRRYFFAESVSEIAKRYRMTENNVTVTLSRTRRQLRQHLEQEGYTL